MRAPGELLGEDPRRRPPARQGAVFVLGCLLGVAASEIWPSGAILERLGDLAAGRGATRLDSALLEDVLRDARALSGWTCVPVEEELFCALERSQEAFCLEGLVGEADVEPEDQACL